MWKFRALPIWFIPGVILGIVFWTWFARAVFAEPLIITHDRGGLISAYVERVASETRPIEIAGYCASACTLYLANPQTCVHRSATLLFHGPSSRGRPLWPADFEHWSRVMAEHYPPALAQWFMETGRYGEFMLAGSAAIEMDLVGECL